MARLPFKANYYELLGLPVSVTPRKGHPDIEAAIKALESRKTDSKAGNINDEIALVVGKSLAQQMRDDLAEDDVPTWKEHHATWKKRARLVENSKTGQIAQLLNVLRTDTLSKNAKELISKEVGDAAIVEKALKKAKMTVFEGNEPNRASGALKGNLKRAYGGLLRLAAFLRIEGADDLWSVLSEASGIKVTRTSSAAALKEVSEALGKKNNDATLRKEIKASYQTLRNGSDNLLNNHDPKDPDAALNLFHILWQIEANVGLFTLLTAFKSAEAVEAKQFERAAAACAKAAGIKTEKAREILLELFEQRKINKPNFRTAAYVPIRACPFCSSLMDASEKKCAACGGAPLANCLNCGSQMDISMKACAACGISVEQASKGRGLLKEANILVARNDIAAAEAAIMKAQQALPDQNLQSRAEELTKLRIKDEAELEALQQLVLARRFEAAQSALARRKEATSSRSWVDLKSKITEVLTEAQEHLTRAERSLAERAFPEAASAATNALNLVSDSARAQEILDSIPPEPPTGLKALTKEGTVALSWSHPQPADQSISFEIYRRIETSSSKAEKVATSEVTRYVDQEAPDGVPLIYNVYARRRRTRSSKAATSSALTVYRPIEVLEIEPILGRVALRWKLPAAASHAEIKVHSASDRPASLARLQPIGRAQRSWTDTGNTIKGSRTYLVTACYGEQQRPKRGPTVTKTVTPQRPPEKIGPFRKSREGVLNWDSRPGPGDRDAIWCFKSDEKLPRNDTLVDSSDLPKPVHKIPLKETRSLAVSSLPKGNFKVVLTRTQGKLMYISAPIEFVHVVPIENPRAVQNGNYFEVTWDWPEGVTKAEVRYTARIAGRSGSTREDKKIVSRLEGKPGLLRSKVSRPAEFDFEIEARSKTNQKAPSRKVHLSFTLPNEVGAKLKTETTGWLKSKTTYQLELVAKHPDRWPALTVFFQPIDTEEKTHSKEKLTQIEATQSRTQARAKDLTDLLAGRKGTITLAFVDEKKGSNLIILNPELVVE